MSGYNHSDCCIFRCSPFLSWGSHVIVLEEEPRSESVFCYKPEMVIHIVPYSWHQKCPGNVLAHSFMSRVPPLHCKRCNRSRQNLIFFTIPIDKDSGHLQLPSSLVKPTDRVTYLRVPHHRPWLLSQLLKAKVSVKMLEISRLRDLFHSTLIISNCLASPSNLTANPLLSLHLQKRSLQHLTHPFPSPLPRSMTAYPLDEPNSLQHSLL